MHVAVLDGVAAAVNELVVVTKANKKKKKSLTLVTPTHPHTTPPPPPPDSLLSLCASLPPCRANVLLACPCGVVQCGRVYSTGFSNGAFMSHRLACQASDVFAAIASVSGVLANRPNLVMVRAVIYMLTKYIYQATLVLGAQPFHLSSHISIL